MTPESSGSRVIPDDSSCLETLNQSITATLLQAIRVIGLHPSLLRSALRFLVVQRRSARWRRDLRRDGVQVPAVVMMSLTKRCNLACTGCYQQAQHRREGSEMTPDQLRSLVSQCADLGVSFLVLAGGEPLLRKDDILPLARDFPDLIFAIYTNGLLIDETLANQVSERHNIIPVISIEGNREETDCRRSEGVYDAAMQAFSLLQQNSAFFGCSVTVTRQNYSVVTSRSFVEEMIHRGCRFFSYVGYVPVDPGTADLLPDSDQLCGLNRCMEDFSEKYPAIFIAFPGDEEVFGGCLSAGRGFVHVSHTGDLEPCPAAPFSDRNITAMTLKEALQSPFLSEIREQHGILSEKEGGCALWKNREWVRSLLQ